MGVQDSGRAQQREEAGRAVSPAHRCYGARRRVVQCAAGLAILLGMKICAQSSTASGAPADTGSGGAVQVSVLTGGFYDTPADLSRFREQAGDPELAPAYSTIRREARSAVEEWEKRFPATAVPRSTDELLAAGRTNGTPDMGYIPLALLCVLDPAAENKRVLREMMMFALGARQTHNYWKQLGIHEGIQVSEYLETYDIAIQLGALTASDHAAIRAEMHQAGHFLEGWLLDNPYSRMYPDKRDTSWCLNFHVMSASTLSAIAMLYPDFPESAHWLRESRSALIEYLMSGFGEDGAYGEGSDRYWELSMEGLLRFFRMSRNLGAADYLKVPAIEDRLRATMRWRINMTAPDGDQFAIGDSDRANDGGSDLLDAASLLDDPDMAWAGRMMLERGNHWIFHERSLLFFAHLDMRLAQSPATNDQALFPLSGFAMFRSGWDDKANAVFFKYGTTYIGRREADRDPVISGHAHEDALEVELHYHGVPVVADVGRRGRYEDWNTYGGFAKATVAHSTVGLGNPWGYDRLDGQYGRHLAEKGINFTYEQTQQNIDPADSRLMAYADLGAVAYVSARDRTYEEVEHQRSVIWFPENSLTVIADRLESRDEQPYEWYLTPVGKPLGKPGELVFGDETAKLQVLPVAPATERVTALAPGTPNLPPYYVGLVPGAPAQATSSDRWSTFSLLILQQKARDADFLNILLPFSGDRNPWSVDAPGNGTRRLRRGAEEVTVASRDAEGPLALAGECGVLARSGGEEQSYALVEGTMLLSEGRLLVSATLSTPVWKGLYSIKLNALVSLKDQRASFDLKPWPADEHLLLNPPRAVPGQEPLAPLRTAVSFYVGKKPERMLVLHGFTGTLQFNDPAWDTWDSWPNDWHRSVARREALDFTYDAATGLVTVQLEPGPNQIVWE